MSAPLSYTITGSNPHKPPLLFLHGWPDDASLWENQIRFFSPRWTCVTAELPGFESSTQQQNGADFQQLTHRLEATVAEILVQTGSAQVILIGHDWGAYLCYLFEKTHPTRVARMITLDVGARIKPESTGHAIFLASYQWWLITAYAIGKVSPALGSAMSRGIAKWGGAPRWRQVHSRMNYPYVYFWRDLLGLGSDSTQLSQYEPHCPLLYLYGKNKPYMFHSRDWIDLLKRNPHGQVHAVAAGHWLMLERPDEVNSVIQNWLEEEK